MKKNKKKPKRGAAAGAAARGAGGHNFVADSLYSKPSWPRKAEKSREKQKTKPKRGTQTKDA